MLGRYDSQKTGFGTLFMVWWGIIDIEQVVGERSRCLTTSLLCRYQVFCSCASVAIQKRGCIERCNLFLRAESEIWTRDPFITSEVLYRWANSAFGVNSPTPPLRLTSRRRSAAVRFALGLQISAKIFFPATILQKNSHFLLSSQKNWRPVVLW